MIKAVFFDWFNTLTDYEPSRPELYRQAFEQYGIKLPIKAIMRGLLYGDMQFFQENAKLPVDKRSPEEQMQVLSAYPKAMLAEAGVRVANELPGKILKIARQQFKEEAVVLFDDVLATLKTLKERHFVLGLITNATKHKLSLHRNLGIEKYLDFIVTSHEVGADKPKPSIFLAALERATVSPTDAVHVGDHYYLDVLGAKAVGINPVLIDRYDLFPEIRDCVRIRSLSELVTFLGEPHS